MLVNFVSQPSGSNLPNFEVDKNDSPKNNQNVTFEMAVSQWFDLALAVVIYRKKYGNVNGEKYEKNKQIR